MDRALAPFEALLSAAKQVIGCPRLVFDEWSDQEPPIFEGSGRIILEGGAAMRFEGDAQARDPKRAMRALRRCAEEPDDHTSALRLRATDYSGRRWNGGWVRPRLGGVGSERYQLLGEIGSLTTDGQHAAGVGSVELAYSPAPQVPFSESMRTSATLGDEALGWRTSGGRHQLEVLGSRITAETRPWREELWIRATASEQLNHPYLENWLSEPLRALRGQLIFPRLVARNFADGRSAVWVRSPPPLTRGLGGCARLLNGRSASEFWSFYAAYLTYIAEHRGPDGHPEFEAHLLTRLHAEVIQARLAGSHWVIALCVASAIEGTVKLDPSFERSAPALDDNELSSVAALIAQSPPGRLRDRLSSFAANLSSPSMHSYLGSLRSEGRITQEQLEAWRKVRNKVAHGTLFEPWGTAQEREQLIALVELFYRLTAIRIGYEHSRA